MTRLHVFEFVGKNRNHFLGGGNPNQIVRDYDGTARQGEGVWTNQPAGSKLQVTVACQGQTVAEFVESVLYGLLLIRA
jgi:hypothetical protein